MKSRHSLYLDDALNKRLDELASKPGASRSAIVRDAVSAYLARQGASELEIAFRERLDRMSGQLNRIEHIQNITLECVAL
ncbi:MAG TPA: ribbon-helix-helix protein, CopG family, partial [Rhizomicrobium sp.]